MYNLFVWRARSSYSSNNNNSKDKLWINSKSVNEYRKTKQWTTYKLNLKKNVLSSCVIWTKIWWVEIFRSTSSSLKLSLFFLNRAVETVVVLVDGGVHLWKMGIRKSTGCLAVLVVALAVTSSGLLIALLLAKYQTTPGLEPQPINGEEQVSIFKTTVPKSSTVLQCQMNSSCL